MMTTRDSYVALLEKRATSEGDVLHDSTQPTDSAELVNEQYAQNQTDHRDYLHSIFSRAGSVQNEQSSGMKKLFSNMPKDTTSGNPLIKVAARQPFFSILQGHGNFLKTASAIHREVAFNAFIDELEKIAGFSPAKKLPDVGYGLMKVMPHPSSRGGLAIAAPPHSHMANGTHAYRAPTSHSNPISKPSNSQGPQPQTSLGSGSVKWGPHSPFGEH